MILDGAYILKLYIPPHFSADQQTALALIQAYPFATLSSLHDGQVYLSQIPLIFKDEHTLIGHLAKANPHSAALLQHAGDISITALFSGPNAYVSPAWYQKNTGIPTWNYANCVVNARLQLLTEPEAKESVVKALIERFDVQAQAVKQAWADLPLASQQAQLGAIVAFELHIQEIQVKHKLSQNRPEHDQVRIAQQLALGTPAEQAIANMMLALKQAK